MLCDISLAIYEYDEAYIVQPSTGEGKRHCEISRTKKIYRIQ